MLLISFTDLVSLAKRAGLHVIGVCDVSPLESERERLTLWQKSYSADMGYMKRDPDLFLNPKRLLPEAESVLLFTIRYSSEPHPKLKEGFGRVARYAWGLDYHIVIKERLKHLAVLIEDFLGERLRFRAFSDAVPLLERAFAKRAGLGFTGKNSLLIQKGYGSYFFLAEIISNLTVTDVPETDYVSDCSTCSRCLQSCPTDAFVSERVLDANRCISYLTIEKKGAFNDWEREALGEWIFGCDVCQDVCPFNHSSLKKGLLAQFNDFNKDSGVGALLDLGMIFSISSEDEFQKKFLSTPLLRAGRDALIRNALSVAVNTGVERLLPSIIELSRSDNSDLVRSEALRAIERFREKGIRYAKVI